MEAGARARVTWDDAMRANWRHHPFRTAAALAAGVAVVVVLVAMHAPWPIIYALMAADLGASYVLGARAVRARSRSVGGAA
jgi:hypothetical protein